MFTLILFITLSAFSFAMILLATYNIFVHKGKIANADNNKKDISSSNNELKNELKKIPEELSPVDDLTPKNMLPKQNIATSTVIEKTEVNNYDFSSLSQTFNYLVIFIIAFFIGKLLAGLFKSANKKFTYFKNQKNTAALIKEFDSVITNENLIINYANKIEEQSVINTILIKREPILKLEILNHELNNKKEIINKIINKNYNFN